MMKLFRYPVVKLFSYDGSIATGMAYLCCELRGTGADPAKDIQHFTGITALRLVIIIAVIPVIAFILS